MTIILVYLLHSDFAARSYLVGHCLSNLVYTLDQKVKKIKEGKMVHTC